MAWANENKHDTNAVLYRLFLNSTERTFFHVGVIHLDAFKLRQNYIKHSVSFQFILPFVKKYMTFHLT